MKALYLSYDGLSDPLGGSQVLPYLIGLSRLGHEISVISFEKPGATRQALDRVQQQCSEHQINWQSMRYHKWPPILSTLWDVAAMRTAAASLHHRKRFDLVHCRSYVPALVGLALKRRHGLRFLFDMRGFWPDERVEGGRWKLGNPMFRAIYAYFKLKERQFFAEADAIVTLTNSARQSLLALSEGERPAADPQVIPCCVDLAQFRPASANQRSVGRKELGIAPDASVLCYLGSLGGNYLLDEMLRFFLAYRERRPGARFLFVTREFAASIVERAGQLGIGRNELAVRSVERDEVPALVSSADHGIAFKRATHAERGCSPTKLGEMMALAIPVVVNAGVGDVDRVICETGAGVVVQGFDHESLLEAVDRLFEIQLPKAEIHAGARRWFDLEIGVKAYDAIYRSMGSD